MAVQANLVLFSAISFFAVHANPAPSRALVVPMSPVQKVVTLLEEMKAQAEKDADMDKIAYDKYACWCETNENQKTADVAAAQAEIEELAALIESATAKMGELKTELAQLLEDIAEDRAALETATAEREKESEAFKAEEADMTETGTLLKQAIEVLSQVQFAQTRGRAKVAAASALIQLRSAALKRYPQFHSVMQQDLFDVLGSLESVAEQVPAPFRKGGAALEQTRLLPWEKTDEQKGKEAKPNSLEGAAAGAKSYNSRSGRIFGILQTMEENVNRDLNAAREADAAAESTFQKLKAAKLKEIAAAEAQKKQKERTLAGLVHETAMAKKSKAKLEKAVEADTKFLNYLKETCTKEQTEYDARVKVRSEEIVAIGEALKILTADDARALFSKTSTMSFIQLSSVGMEERSARAMHRLADVAKKHDNPALAVLALRTHLDAFTKVKEAMDKMLAELQRQQKEEYEKYNLCQKQIDETEDDIKVGENTRDDLTAAAKKLANKIAAATAEIEDAQHQIVEYQVTLKEAGVQRKLENANFQQGVADQRATMDILTQTLNRLKEFYEPELMQMQHKVPGAATYKEPERPADYTKHGSGGGVLQMIQMIIEDAGRIEKQLVTDEQQMQRDYEQVARDINEGVGALRASIVAKTAEKAADEANVLETNEAQSANDAELEKLANLLKDQHVECDYVVKYYDVRQKARAEEMDAIQDAKAIISGADFGKEVQQAA